MAGRGARNRILDRDLYRRRFLCRWPSQSTRLSFRVEKRCGAHRSQKFSLPLLVNRAQRAPRSESNLRTFKYSTEGGFSGGLEISIGLND